MTDETRDDAHNVVILGSGAAGLTAAIYAARAALRPIVVGGSQHGGQLTLTSDVENFPGFEHAIQGPDLMEAMRKQAERFQVEFINGDATSVDFRRRPFQVVAGDETLLARAVIIATGAGTNWLGLANEQRLVGHGVSSCAPCDAFFFRGKEVAVVGGGDSAMEEALFLAKFATKVTIVHRRDAFRASKIMIDRALRSEKIGVRWNTVVEDVLGDGEVKGVLLRDTVSGRGEEFRTDGLFVAIGHHPNTELFRGQIELDANGYIVLDHHSMTSVDGVFAAGDCHDHRYRQAITAAGYGCMAAMDAEKYIEARHG
ncbi:MAG TPA: thioredoxin-disulfide reductase [bacterium]|nr:thioredoxin-disulfide reductase [bacterium]